MSKSRPTLTLQRRAALEAERRRLFEQLRARLFDPRRAGISHADFMRLSGGGQRRVPESAGGLTSPTAGHEDDGRPTAEAAPHDGVFTPDDVFDINVARSVIYLTTRELMSELADSVDLNELSDETLVERARLRCLEVTSVVAAFERWPETLGTAIRLSVHRLRHWGRRRAGAGLSAVQNAKPFDESDSAEAAAPVRTRKSNSDRPAARASDALKQKVDAEMDAAFHRNVAEAKANRKARRS